jgi:hypothetical protein
VEASSHEGHVPRNHLRLDQDGPRAEHMHLPLDVHEREALARKDRYVGIPPLADMCSGGWSSIWPARIVRLW